MSQQASGQLPLLENSIRNEFRVGGGGVPSPGGVPRTAGQFENGTALGGWQTTRITKGNGTLLAGSTNAAAGDPGTIVLPSGNNGNVQLASAVMARPMVLRVTTYSLGQEIPRPDRDENGVLLSESDYYLEEPANAENDKFYWSPHAQKVFAVTPGLVEVEWVVRSSGDLVRKTYVISGSAVKEPKKIYWTERGFNGPMVNVPEARVSDVHVAYNNLFPASVSEGEDYQTLNDPPVDPDNTLPAERRTLWFDRLDNNIHAYNREGRVFVELLGDLRPPGFEHREHLGFEIVDVIQEVRPEELRVSVGEKVLPKDESVLTEEDAALVADIVAGAEDADPYLYEHIALGGTQRTLYAIKETTPLIVIDRNSDGVLDELDEQQSNEVLIYWKEEGVMQLLWPKSYAGYIFKWPEEFLDGEASEEQLREFYSLYARPELVGDLESTGVQLDSADNPTLVYQDSEGNQHAFLSEQNIFHTNPAEGSRSLIRYLDGDNIWFQRVYSIPNHSFLGYDATVPVLVGRRILPPSQVTPLVGYIRETSGNAYNATAYIDPFTNGFDAAGQGAIIPVNALEGNDELEVWWYEQSIPPAGTSFTGANWPSYVKRYRQSWHVDPPALPALPSAQPEIIYNFGALPSYNNRNVSGVTNVDRKDATFVVDIDFSDWSGSGPEVIWETGGVTNGIALSYQEGNELRLEWVTGGQSAVVSRALTNEEIEAGFLQIGWTIDVNGTPANASITLWIEGVVVDSAPGVAGGDYSDWSGSNAAGFGLVGDVNFIVDSVGLESGVVDPVRGLRFYPGQLLDPLPTDDTDGDGLFDDWERAYFPNDLTALSTGGDFDEDGLLDEEEYQKRWDPTIADTDRDGETDDIDEPYDLKIVMARNDGSGELGIAATGSIYRQPDPSLPGYNPNEEHALMSGGVAWALRDDLNIPTSSEPYVLVDYTAEDGRPAMVVREVVREDATHTFNYSVDVGVILQAPMPLPVIPLPIGDDGLVRNVEVGAPEDQATHDNGTDYYDRFTYVDRKGSTWIYRGVHDLEDEGTAGFLMNYYYKTQADFDFPSAGTPAPPVGTIVPYLSDSPVTGEITDVTPADVKFTPIWPKNPAVLNLAETLGLPKRGLPAVRGQISAKVLYQQSIANSDTQSVVLHDPTRAKVFELSSSGLDAIPGSVATSDYLGKTYFPQLPPHLSERFFFDPNIGPLGALVLIGEFVDAPLGEDYFQLNVLSSKDEDDIKNLADVADTNRGAWETAIENLETTLETFVEDPGRRGVYIPDSTQDWDIGPNELATIVSDNTAVDSYALTAVGGGEGYVVMAMGDGAAFTPEASPVALEVFKVSNPLYRGELKIVQSANPLDEKLTLQYSGDFAGEPSGFEFSWLTAQPVAGFPPLLYSFSALEILANGPTRSWAFDQNPTEGYESVSEYSYDDSGWDVPGNLSSNQIVINDGNGSAENGVTLPNALLRESFDWAGDIPIDLYLSLEIADRDGAIVSLNGAEIAAWNVPGRENSIPTSAPGTISGNTLPLVFSVSPQTLQANNVILVELYTSSDPGVASSFDLRLDSQQETEDLSGWQPVGSTVKDDPGTGSDESMGEDGKMRHIIEGASVLTLTDNYFTMRYRKTGEGEWSRWSTPQLAEGWIKRALAGINPFEQRITDLFSNSVNTDVSLLSQAGPRWEGNIALNLANIDDFGLIEIYETILNRGKDLSIEGAPPLNVPAANDALLLAAGYLNDLYLLVGNEAYADAANPTIAFDTDGGDFGEFNTALFAFKGQLATVLDEELALLRGRDDNLQPGVEVSPVYNRLVWNFTNGINSGEAIYSLNYNIQDSNVDGAADAVDAAEQFPQGHGDAYGHYLTALKVYYGLLNNPNFAWTPRVEAVSVLGQPVSIDYQDERKFSAAGAALSRAASQTLDLTYRQEFTANENAGWSHLRDGEVNSRTGVARYWGTDEWACRAGQGALFHWVTANSILPETDPVNEGIEKVDRTTVPELDEIVAQAKAIQETLDNADARLNPLGLSKGTLSFDISPNEIDEGKTHYEQVYDRAIGSLKNAVFAFNNAKRSTQFLRQQDNSVDEQRAVIEAQEQAFQNELIEIYGTPYPDDIGPGKTYAQGYAGPDLLHFGYAETPELFFDPSLESQKFLLPLDPSIVGSLLSSLGINGANSAEGGKVSFQLNSEGDLVKPAEWAGRRAHPGAMQTAISELLAARHRVVQSIDAYESGELRMDQLLAMYSEILSNRSQLNEDLEEIVSEMKKTRSYLIAAKVARQGFQSARESAVEIGKAAAEFLPTAVGTSNDGTAPARGGILTAATVVAAVSAVGEAGSLATSLAFERQLEELVLDLKEAKDDATWANENRQLIDQLLASEVKYRSYRAEIDVALRKLDEATRNFQATKARGLAVQVERETFRKRAAAIIQGYRTRDLAFRVFRDEALEKYKTLFDLSARYTFLAARAYDYETGLLDGSGSSAAAGFYDGIVQSRALGVVDSDGEPQFSSSSTGDPGLAGVLAQMQGDWSVAKTRLGFNNPDRYRTSFSLRSENFRIAPNSDGDQAWKDKLVSFTKDNVLDDPDVRRNCLQIDPGNGLPVPGLVIPFQTTITRGHNFFGQPLLAHDGTFSPSSFATKIRASGIAFKGYVGMDDPTSIGGDVSGAGGDSPDDPDLGFLDENALSRTPHIYLIPVGADLMRAPAFGDTSEVRSWTVEDQAIPLPFNIGNTDFSDNESFLSTDSLSEAPFAIRKHQAFRAVPSGTVFSSSPGFTNSRLIGRSVWNTQWKIVIPGETLLNNPEVGLEIFNNSVEDIELFLETYSYSGN